MFTPEQFSYRWHLKFIKLIFNKPLTTTYIIRKTCYVIESVKVSERGCAPQSRDEHVYRDGSWHTENKIEGDVYRVGCEPSETPGPQSSTEYCYCATNLCNAAEGPRDHTDIMLVMFVFNILKYVRSMR